MAGELDEKLGDSLRRADVPVDAGKIWIIAKTAQPSCHDSQGPVSDEKSRNEQNRLPRPARNLWALIDRGA